MSAFGVAGGVAEALAGQRDRLCLPRSMLIRACSAWCRASLPMCDGLPEYEAPTRALWSELGCWAEGDVDFQAARQEEHPVDRRSGWQVPVVDRGEVLTCGLSTDVVIGPVVVRRWVVDGAALL